MGKQGLEMDQKRDSATNRTEQDGEQERRLDLSVPQVAGSALAAIAAAVLASRLGVYGTIIGAGVVSVVATCGGSVFQHFFRRTGEQIREVTVQAKPKGRQVPVPPAASEPWPEDVRTRLIPQVPQNGDAEATRLMPQLPHSGPQDAPGEKEFSPASTHGTRVRGWKRSVIAAAVVFGVAMIGVTGYELASGSDLSGGKGTTLTSVVRGGSEKSSPPSTPSQIPSHETEQNQEPGHGQEQQSPNTGTGNGQSTDPDAGQGDGGTSAVPTPDPTESTGGDPTPTPTPTPTPSGSTGTTPDPRSGAGAGAATGE
ncbi:hypothetical protein [Streptomyces lunaelactis]|uniref:hypothetical protein n=1 Tax=Streptomyces lunaelactis TaxID=1535768 RepID=UPI0020C788FE|nr:hypothetical protein [Streptomyces lunaelactis]